MPYIESKVTMKLSAEKEEIMKAKLGKAIALINKPESYLMIGFEDEYSLFMGGERLEKGAYVSVSLFGKASSEAYEKLTGAICDIMAEELGIAGNHVYVTYHEIDHWGWNGSNF